MDWGLPWRHTQSKHRDQFGCCPRLKCVPASKRPVVNLQKKKGGDNHQIDCLLTPSPSPNLWLSHIDCNRYIEEKENPEWHRPKWLFLTVAQERIEREFTTMQLCNKHTSNFPKWLYFPDDLHYSATRTLGKLKQSNLRIQEGSQERKKALFDFPKVRWLSLYCMYFVYSLCRIHRRIHCRKA